MTMATDETQTADSFKSHINPNSMIGLSIPNTMLEQEFLEWLVEKQQQEEQEDKRLIKKNAGELMINELLKLSNPRLTKPIVEYLKEPGSYGLIKDALEHFLGNVTMLPAQNSLVVPSLQTSTRPNTSSPSAIVRSYRVMECLAIPNVAAKPLFIYCQVRLITTMIRVFSTESEGSFHHFRKIFQAMINRCPDAVYIFLNETCDDEEPLLLLMLPYIINSAVQDCLISFFVKVATKYEYPERGVILQKILESGFVDGLFSIILHSTNQDILMNCLSVFKRMLFCGMEGQMFVLVLPLIGENSLLASLLDRFQEPTLSKACQSCYIDILYSIFANKGNFLNDVRISIGPIFSQKLNFIAPLLPTFPLSHQCLLIKMISVLSTRPDFLAQFSESIPWDYLVDAFFNCYSTCSIYLVHFCQLFEAVTATQDSKTISILRNMGFFERLLEKFNCNEDVRAFVRILLLNIRLYVAKGDTLFDFVGDFEEWDSIVEHLDAWERETGTVPVIETIPKRIELPTPDVDNEDDEAVDIAEEEGLDLDLEVDNDENDDSAETWPDLSLD